MSGARAPKADQFDLCQVFQQQFGAEPQVFRAPGRVNLIGEHTDYNDGFVLPCAIDFYTQVAISSRQDGKLVLRSTEYEQAFELNAASLPERKLGAWCDYVVGVARELNREGCRFSGANLLVHGDVPVGAGLSSSASLEVAAALAFERLAGVELPLKTIATLCQRAENDFVGARVGIMDQFVCCVGKQEHAVLIDCRSLDFELAPLPKTVVLVICNTMVKHELSSGEYNRRREECEAGVKILSNFYPGIRALRDITVDQLSAHRSGMPPVVYNRCLHVVEENARTIEAARRLKAGDIAGVAELIRDSHRSLRDLYEVSCPELDAMVDAAEGLPGYIAGRMTGGGFGGCTINLVEKNAAESFAKSIAARYRMKTGITPDVFQCFATNGAGAEFRGASVHSR